MKRETFGGIAKTLLMERLEKDLSGARQVFVVGCGRLSSPALAALRKKLRDQKTRFRVVKNTIARKVFEKTSYPMMKGVIDGQCGLGLSAGEVTDVSKALVEFAEENEQLQIRSLSMDGQVYGLDRIKVLAKLPSRHVLLSMLCGRLKSPQSGLVNVLSGTLRNLVNVLEQVKKQREQKGS